MEKVAVYTSIIIIAILTILALFGDSIVPHSPTLGELRDRLQPPFWVEGGSMKYPLGTDSVGRCMLSRLISGTKYSMGISILSIVISALIGVTVGLLSGFLGGLVEAVLMRLVDLLIAFSVQACLP